MAPKQNNHTLLWLDLYVSNLDRAIAFYQEVLNASVRDARPHSASATLQLAANGTGLTLIETPGLDQQHPSTSLPYFNCSGRLSSALAKAKLQGGEVLQTVQSMEPFGFRAIIKDPDGNRIALHSVETS